MNGFLDLCIIILFFLYFIFCIIYYYDLINSFHGDFYYEFDKNTDSFLDLFLYYFIIILMFLAPLTLLLFFI